MLKTLCGFLFLGALIVGCACDFQCFLDRQMKRSQISTIIPTDFNGSDPCKDSEKGFDDIRKDIKECSVTKITVDKLEAFMEEICLENGTLRESYQNHSQCFMENIKSKELLLCLAESNIDIKPEDKEKPLEVIKAVCTKIDGLYNCFNVKFGELCGDEAGKLTQKFTGAISSYTTGICAEANGASVNSVLFMNILLGFLCVLMMWHKN